MAKSCGIRVGPRRFELVVLDGSPKKHRITGFATGEFPQGTDDPVGEAAATLRDAIRKHKVPTDAVSIAIDTGLAAFRTLTLPSLDPNKIEEIIKFEVEGQLPQWNIDDVVCDFHKMEQAGSEDQLLVTSVQKDDIARCIDLCSEAGIEPLEVELEATAMVNAALSADICHVDDAQVLVHIGEASTAVVVMDGGRVRSMRAIHIGALTHEPGPRDPDAEDEENGDEPDLDFDVDPDEVQRRLEQVVSRIRRELGRTLSGARTANPIDAVYVCGWELPDLVGSTVLDIPIYELDAFEEDGGQPAQGAAPLVVPYGVALRQLGGGYLQPRLRREELRYTGAFERVELPLAVAMLMIVTGLAVFNIFEFQQIKLRTLDVTKWLHGSVRFLAGDPKQGQPGNLNAPLDGVDKYVARVDASIPKKAGETPSVVLEDSRLEQLEEIERLLRIGVSNLEEELGQSGEVSQPQSALEAMTRVTSVLTELGPEVGRWSIRRANAAYRPGRGGRDDSVEVALDLSFFDESATTATTHFEAYSTALKGKDWVKEVDRKGTEEFESGGGIFTNGFLVVCDLSQIPVDGGQ